MQFDKFCFSCHRYHRILKKEEQKTLGKIDLETLAVENPELFQYELEKAERLRATVMFRSILYFMHFIGHPCRFYFDCTMIFFY